MFSSRSIRLALAAGVAAISGVFHPVPAAAQAPMPVARLTLVQPSGGRIGTSFDVAVQGSELDDATNLLFSAVGVSARWKSGTTFAVSIDSNAVPALVDVRVAGRFGVSNPRRFELTDLPSVMVPSTNTQVAAAFSLPLDTTVQGHASANARDYFTVPLRKGQHITLRVLGRELDSKIEPVLSVLDTAGRELDRARRPQLEIDAPADGAYTVVLHDALFRGGDDYLYRLTAATGPSVEFALPMVLKAGVTNRVTLFGRNLVGGKPGSALGADGRPLDELVVDVVAPRGGDDAVALLRRGGAVLETFSWSHRATNGRSAPLVFGLSPHPVFAIPTSGTNTVVPVSPPAEVSGRFPGRRGLAGASFAAKKGEAFWIEVQADRLGLHADPSAIVQRLGDAKDADGNAAWSDVMEVPELDGNIGDRDFNTATRDCGGRFEAPADGLFRVVVKDLFHLASPASQQFFNLVIRPLAPDFRLVAVPPQPPKPKDDNREVHPVNAVVRRGGTVAVKILAFRRDGFSGDIELAAVNLPKAIRSATGRIHAGQNTGLLLVTAADEATSWSGWLQVVGRARIGDAEVERRALGGGVVWHLPDYDQAPVVSRLTAGFGFAVAGAEAAPVVVAVDPAKPLEAVADSKLSIPVSVVRRGEFTAAFNLKPAGRPELDKAKDTSVPEKGTNATIEINLAELKLPVGTHTLWLQGQCAGKYRNQPEAADEADRGAKAAEKEAAEAAAAAKMAAEQLAALKDPKPDAKAAAEKRVAETAARAKDAEARKASSAQRAKDLTERAKPRDVLLPLWSAPFTVRVSAPAKPADKK